MSSNGLMFCFRFRTAQIRRLICLLSFLIFPDSLLTATPHGAEFTNDELIETNLPYLTLKWRASKSGNILFEIEMAESPDFSNAETWYRGPDKASFISGLAEGTYFFRIRTLDSNGIPGSWSDTVTANIQYDSLTTALILFTIGGIVSVSTIAMVLIGDRKARMEEAETA